MSRQESSEKEPDMSEIEIAATEGEIETKSEEILKVLEDDYSFSFCGKAPNDVTGKWYWASYADTKVVEEFIVDYYNKYFVNKNDLSEVHMIYNFTNSTVACVKLLGDNLLYVHTHEIVDKEYLDASKMAGGILLDEKYVDINTGEIIEPEDLFAE